MKIDLDLMFVWSITEKGEPYVELVPRNRPNEPKAEFTFDTDLFVKALNEDIRLEELDYDEWFDLVNYLKDTASELESKLKETVNEPN